MRKIKWICLILCLLALGACGKTYEVKTVAGPEQETSEKIPRAQYELIIDGKKLRSGGRLYGSEICVNWEQISKRLQLTQMPQMCVGLYGQVHVMLEELCEQEGFACVVDEKNKCIYVTTPNGAWQIPEGYEVPVLMYHGVSDDTWGGSDLFISPANMEAQIKYLVDHGYTPIWFEDLPNVAQIEKPVILTYDDGYMDNYLELYPILQKYQVKATIFVITGSIDYNPKSLTSEQIREMSDSGLVSIQSHTVTHPYLGSQTPQQQEYELVQSQLTLAGITGKLPEVICYPSGNFNETTLELAKKYYRMGINMNGNQYITGEDPYRVDRYYITRRDSVETIAAYIQ